jgi:hypothetical protein
VATVLINPNVATVQTTKGLADSVRMEGGERERERVEGREREEEGKGREREGDRGRGKGEREGEREKRKNSWFFLPFQRIFNIFL